METFADVLHAIIDTVFTGDAADKAHSIIDQASGQRTPAPEPEPAPEAPAADPTPSAVPGADEEPPGVGGAS